MTSDASKTKAQLIEELNLLRARSAANPVRELLDHSPLPYMSVDGEARLLAVNRAWLDMLGYGSEDEVVGRGIGEFLDEASRRRHNDVFPGFLEQGAASGLEYTLLRRDGSPVLVSLDSQMERTGKGARAHAILHDITARRRSERRLSISEQRFRGLFDATADGILFTNLQGVIVEVNPALATLLGRTREELLGVSAHSLSPDEFGPHIGSVFCDPAVGQGRCGEYEKAYYHADGSLVPVLVHNGVIRDEKGAPQAAWALVKDLSGQREAVRSQRLYRMLAENSGDVLWTLDNELRITYISPSISSLRGYLPEEMIGRSVLDGVTPASRVCIEKAYWRLIADEAESADSEPRLNEAELVRKDGSTVWAEVVVRTMRNEKGERIGFMGATRDISERKRMELRVRDSERSLRALFEATADAMALLSREGTILTLNRNMAELLRLDPAKAVGRPVLDSLSGRLREELRQAFGHVVSSGGASSLQASFRGRELDAAMYPVTDEAGRISKVAAYVRDVTARIQAEQALEQRAVQYRRIVETVNEGIMGLDAGGRVTYANRKTGEFLGRGVGRMLGQPVAGFLAPEVREAMEGRFLSPGEAGPGRFECRFLREDGEEVWGLVSAAPLREESGEFIGVFAMIADITESKRAEALLRESEARYRNIFEHSVAGLFQSLPEGRFLNVNPSLARILGYDTPEHVMESVTDIWTQLYADVGDRTRMLAELRREVDIRDHEVRMLRRDGEVLWVAVNVRAVHDAEGRPEMYEGSIVDITERKRAEEALRLTQYSVDVAPIDIFWVDERGRLVYVNEAAVKSLGYSREEMLTMSISDVNSEIGKGEWASYWADRRSQGILRFEAVHRRRDGSPMPVGVTSHHRRYGGRELLFAYAYDLTERNRVEEELRRSQELLNEVQRISRTGGWEYDLEANELHWTEGQYRLHGVRPDSRPFSFDACLDRYVLPEDRAKLASVFTRVIRDKRPLEVEYRPALPGNEETILVGKAIPELNAAGVVRRVYGSTRDVTLERRAAENLRKSHERLLTILDAIDADIFVSTLDGEVVLFMNAHMREAFNAAPEDAQCLDLFRDDPDQRGPEASNRLLNEAGEPVDTLVRERYNPRTRQWSLDHDRAIRWLGGEMVHMHMSADITELKNMAEDLRVAMSEAKAASLAKNEFLANMSHEIRTPLNGLLGMLQILQLSDLDEEQRDYLDTAVNSGRNLLQILNDILDLSKVESGKLELEGQPFELGELLESVVSVFRFQAEARGLSIDWRIDESLPRHFIADKGRLRQILFNLVGNASKFTETGWIEVAAYPLAIPMPDGRVRIFFAVSDSGIGIPDGKLDTVFDPFTQVDGSSTRKYQGTGLGLGIVRRLVTLMGGNVSMESDLGTGTTVAFTVGADCAEHSAGGPAVPAAEGAGGLSILVAEDERINRAVVEHLLGRLGHRVVCVENGEKALDALRAGQFDCVLMDIQMPGLDGMAITRAIREDLGLSLPVVALTAHAMKGDRDRFLAAGMNGYVAKPFDLSVLEAELHRVVAEWAG
ncbi:PAS domain S-box protein [Pseudodesulfovibrio sp.]|uniref:PAS domain-containing hybrid sensor histidine kinase/response regulator n=1 Tax=Pseudodesulfovibrio sp. TaxID=2035812 RepID=UPI0026132D18|nr:PAS domain S-box protein [Pseudodesulfovibrio sp.]MDD3311070.1 PAS domain S-box protein [Pseudodesulfovibrio sp.]